MVFLLQSLTNLFLIALLLRVYLQWLRVSLLNPFAQFIVKLTDFIVLPLKRLISDIFLINLVILALVIVLQFVTTLAWYGLQGFPFAVAGSGVLPGFLILSLVALLVLICHMLIGLVLISAILSLVDPFSVHAASFEAMTAPLLRPFRQVLPLLGNIDLSPMAFVLLCQLIDVYPLAQLGLWANSLI